MSTSETSNKSEILKDANQLQKNPRTPVQNILVNFKFSPSRSQQHFFRYFYFYFFGLYLLDIIQIVIAHLLVGKTNNIVNAIAPTRNLLLILVGLSLVILSFNIWKQHIPIVLKYVFDNKCILSASDDFDIFYHKFLENYQKALYNRRRYLLICGLIVITAIYYYFAVFQPGLAFVIANPDPLLLKISYIIHLILFAFFDVAGMYYLGEQGWVTYLSGRYINKLIQSYELNVKPLHPDKCGGLKELGSFCFGLLTPLLIAISYFTGYIFVALKYPNGTYDITTIIFILFLFVVYALPLAVFAFFIPIWSIHMKMLKVREFADESYATTLAILRQQIQALLNDERLEEVETKKKKMELIQSLYIAYPSWPLRASSNFYKTLFTLCSSAALGFLTALQQPIVQSIIHR